MDTKRSINILLLMILIIMSSSISFAGEYDSLKGVNSVKAIFDIRIPDPKVASVHLDLLHKTFNDKNLTVNSKKPDFAVIFMGPAVRLISGNRAGLTEDQNKYLDTIAGTVSDVAKDGIRLEVCDAAVHLTGGDTDLILPGIKHVPNGLISAIGYQLNGYALISAF